MKARIEDVEVRECTCNKVNSMLIGKSLTDIVKKYYEENPEDYEKVCKKHDQAIELQK